MKRICIIPARGGSKRIPKKNIRPFNGKPIIAYSITAALGSGLFDEVMVSTDSEEIAQVARKYGASVPFYRSAWASSDTAITYDVLYEVLNEYKKRGQEFDTMCCLYSCAPFVTAKKLQDACAMLENNATAESLTPVCAFSTPPQRALHLVNGHLEYLHPEFYRWRSQDLEPIYHDCGQFYFYKIAPWLDHIYGSNGGGIAIPLIVPEEETQDVDNESDWRLAEIKYQYLMEEKK